MISKNNKHTLVKILDEEDKINKIENYKKQSNSYNTINFEQYYITINYKINKNSNNVKIFGTDFVNNNKNNCMIIHCNKFYKLSEYFDISDKYKNNENNLNKDILEIKLLGINKITDLSYMFSNCITLLSLPDLSKLDTSNVTKISYMFNNCKSLLSLPDISNWNTSNIIYMDSLFKSCKLLTYLPDISKWDTSNVEDMSYMFCNCESLLSLPDISKWNISKVKNMSCMFIHCKSLFAIPDISEWNKPDVIDMSCMFYNCVSLSLIKNKYKFSLSDKKYDLFGNCINIINDYI